MFLRFQREFSLSSFIPPQEFKSEFDDICTKLSSYGYRGTVHATVTPTSDSTQNIHAYNNYSSYYYISM